MAADQKQLKRDFDRKVASLDKTIRAAEKGATVLRDKIRQKKTVTSQNLTNWQKSGKENDERGKKMGEQCSDLQNLMSQLLALGVSRESEYNQAVNRINKANVKLSKASNDLSKAAEKAST